MLWRMDSNSWTKDNGDLTHFNTMACREYTLPRDDGHHNQEDGSRETQKLDPCWKLQTSHGSNKFVMNL